ncbi:MAG: M56 family metallopeptidase, partial [Evtepia sp.]
MDQFISVLLTMTAAATAAALAVMILRLLLKKAPRWITCALWLVVFLRMVCPVSLDLPVSLMPASITSGAAAERVIPTTITPTVPETTPAQSAPAAAEEAEPAAAAPAANPEPASPGLDRNDFLFAVWVMGAAGMALWGAVSYLRLRRRISEAVRLEGNLYETDRIDTPFVCGFFRPRIYLPVGLS